MSFNKDWLKLAPQDILNNMIQDKFNTVYPHSETIVNGTDYTLTPTIPNTNTTIPEAFTLNILPVSTSQVFNSSVTTKALYLNKIDISDFYTKVTVVHNNVMLKVSDVISLLNTLNGTALPLTTFTDTTADVPVADTPTEVTLNVVATDVLVKGTITITVIPPTVSLDTGLGNGTLHNGTTPPPAV